MDADKISHEIMETNETLKREVCEAFGAGNVMADDGKQIDRDKLGKIIFNDPSQRRTLNKLTHKRIFIEILRQILKLRFAKGQRFVILDAPLLFESKILEYFCFPILVIAILDESKLRKRLMNRDSSSPVEAQKRIDAQMPLQVKADKADIVIDNSGTVKDLEGKALEVMQAIFELLDYDKHGFIKEDTDDLD